MLNSTAPRITRPLLTISGALLLALLFLLPSTAFCLSGKLNLNTASVKELQQLPFIGHKKASKIVNYRRRHGAFIHIDDLAKTDTIGQDTLEAITPYLTLSGRNSLINNRQTSNGRSKKVFALNVRKPPIHTRPGDIKALADGEYFKILRQYIRSAQRNINIAMFLFKTTDSPKNRAGLLIKELITARRRGVWVRVILEKSSYSDDINKENRRVAKKLRRNNIEVRFDSAKITSHAKLVIIDQRYCFVGSHNFTHSALGRNHEMSLLVDSPALARQLGQYIDRKIKR